MAWTTPRTWVTGEIVTAAIGNLHWRDNLLAAVSQYNLSPADFVLGAGAAYAIVGSAGGMLRADAWAFDGAGADEYIIAQFIVPGWLTVESPVPTDMYWAPSGAGAGNVKWELQVTVAGGSEQVDQAAQWTNTVTTAAPGVADQVTQSTFGNSTFDTAPGVARVVVRRNSADAADTYAADAWFFGLAFVI